MTFDYDHNQKNTADEQLEDRNRKRGSKRYNTIEKPK